MPMNKYPKECPFCGNEKTKLVKVFLTPLPMVICDNCGATVSFRGGENPMETLRRYNRRTGKNLN